MRPDGRQLSELLFGWRASELELGEHLQSPGDCLNPGLVETTIKEQSLPSVVAAVEAVRVRLRNAVENRTVT